MAGSRVSDKTLRKTWDDYQSNGCNATATAKATGIPRQTIQGRITLAASRLPNIANDPDNPHRQKPTIIVRPRFRIQHRGSQPKATRRVLAIGDCHDSPKIPDKSRFEAMGKLARTEGVDEIVQIGDFTSIDSLNRFDKNETMRGREKPSFHEDMVSFQSALRRFDKGLAGYDVPKHITLGNHEDRIFTFANNHPELAHMLDEMLYAPLDDHGWTYSPFGEVHFIGDVAFTHSPINGMGKPYGGVHCQNQIARDAMHDIVFGHTHKRTDMAFPKMGNEHITIINLGTSLPDGHVEQYARHSLTGWSYGVYLMNIIDGKISTHTWIPMKELVS